MVTRTPKETQAALGKAARLSGLSRNVIAAQKRNMKTFLDEVEGKEKAAVTREDMTKVGLDFKKSGDLTKYLNMERKKGRKPIEGDFRTTIKAQDKPDVPLVSPSANKDKPKTAPRGSKVVISGGRASGSTTTNKEIKPSNKKEKDVDSILTKGANFIKENPSLLIGLVPFGVGGLAVGGGLALGRGLTKYIIRKHGKQALNKVKSEIKKAAKKKNISKKVTKGKVVSKTPMGPATPRGKVVSKTPMGPKNKLKIKKTGASKRKEVRERKGIEGNTVIDSRTGRITESAKKADRKRRREQIKRDKERVKKAVEKDKKEAQTARESAANKAAEKKRLEALLQNPLTDKKRKDEIRGELKNLKKGGLIKRNIGGTVLKDIPAGNKGLPNLPTPVRNKMGFKKKGGTIKRSKGGLLGVGKALRGFGAVARKKGGKIAY
jgi:hypothetical protein